MYFSISRDLTVISIIRSQSCEYSGMSETNIQVYTFCEVSALLQPKAENFC